MLFLSELISQVSSISRLVCFCFDESEMPPKKSGVKQGSGAGLVFNEEQIQTVAAQVAEQLQSMQQNCNHFLCTLHVSCVVRYVRKNIEHSIR